MYRAREYTELAIDTELSVSHIPHHSCDFCLILKIGFPLNFVKHLWSSSWSNMATKLFIFLLNYMDTMTIHQRIHRPCRAITTSLEGIKPTRRYVHVVMRRTFPDYTQTTLSLQNHKINQSYSPLHRKETMNLTAGSECVR